MINFNCKMNLFFVIPLIFSLNARGERPLDLEAIKRYSVSNNFLIKAQRLHQEQSQAQILIEKSLMYPRLSLIAGPELKSTPLSSEMSNLSYFQAHWNLFHGFRDQIRLEISELDSLQINQNLNQQEFLVGLDVEKTFYHYLFIQSKLNAYEKSLSTNEKHKQLLKHRQYTGMASPADVMEFDLRESYLKSELLALGQELKEAKLALLKLMGPNLDSDFVPFGDMPSVEMNKNLSELLKEVRETNQDIKKSILDLSIGGLLQKEKRFSWLPTVDLQFQYGRLADTKINNTPSYYGTILLNWEFFSGFSSRNEMVQTELETQSRDFVLRQRILESMADIESLFMKFTSIHDRIEVEKGNEERAQKYYKMVLTEFQRGVKNGSDLKVAEDMMLYSLLRSFELKFQLLESKILLEKSLGRSI